MLGIEPRFDIAAGLDDEDAKREVAIELNEARRQLSREEIRERHLALRAEGKSVRKIAEETGASKSTVARNLATVPSGTVEPDRIVGMDGKSRPARRADSAMKVASQRKVTQQVRIVETTVVQAYGIAVIKDHLDTELIRSLPRSDRTEHWERELAAARVVITRILQALK